MEYKRFGGSVNEYQRLHYWIAKNLGKPSICENCESSTAPRYHWANISEKYKRELGDWVRLCARCHTLIDGRGLGLGQGKYCRRGHELTSETIYILSNGGKTCHVCKLETTQRYKVRAAA